MSVKVCHLTSVHGAYDVRIFQKMCLSLAGNGFDVTLIVANATSEIKDGVNIVGVPVPFSSRLSRMRHAASAVYHKALEIDADIYHIHDPELLPYAVKLQKRGKKVIFDSHEDVPQDILGKSWLGPMAVRKVISRIYNVYEKRQVLKLSGVVSVVESITAKFGHPSSITIHNYPRLEIFEEDLDSALIKVSDKVLLVHHGGLSEMRGTHFMIEAMSYLNDDYELVLMGPWETDAYRALCESTKGWDHVRYLGNLPLQKCYSVLRRCDLGLVLLRPFPSFKGSLPIKAYEYIGVPLPMLMSNFPFWQEQFGNYAHFVDPERPEEIAREIMRISSLREVERTRVKLMSDLILATKTWKAEEQKLIEFYHHI